MPASRTLASVIVAVAIMRGRMEALMTAVRVRVVSPYRRVISWPQVVSRPASPAQLAYQLLAAGVVDAEGSGRHQHLRALGDELGDSLPHLRPRSCHP